MPVPRTLREEQWAACSEHRGRGALHFSVASLKGHQATPCVHVCACTCVHQSLLFPPSPCTALKSVWQSQPNLTAGLRSQIHQVFDFLHSLRKRGEIEVRNSSEEKNHSVSSPLISHERIHMCNHFRDTDVIRHQSIHAGEAQEAWLHKFHCSLSSLLHLLAFIQLFWGLQRICSADCTRTTHSGTGK